MATLSLTNTFIAGTLAKSSEVNQNFTDIINWASGNIENDNLGIMTGEVTWNITTGDLAIDIANAGNEGSINITQTSVLNPNKSVFKITDSAAEVSADAVMFLEMNSLSSTIPLFRADYAGETVFRINKHRIILPQRTKAQRDALAVTPEKGSLVYIEDASPSRHRGVSVYHAEGWSQLSVPPGTVIDFAGSTAPEGYLLCDGSAVSRTTYSTLFATIGTTWGVGDGSTTFNLPDLRRRVVIGSGGTALAGPANTLGSVGGHEMTQQHGHGTGAHDHGGSTSTNGAHTHLVPADTDGGIFGFNISGSSAGFGSASAARPTQSSGSHGHSINNSGTLLSDYGSGDSENMQPSVVMNKLIKW